MWTIDNIFPVGFVWMAKGSEDERRVVRYFLVTKREQNGDCIKLSTFHAFAQDDKGHKRLMLNGISSSGVITGELKDPMSNWDKVIESRIGQIHPKKFAKVTSEFDFFRGEAYLAVLKEARRLHIEPLYLTTVDREIGEGEDVRLVKEAVLIQHSKDCVII